MFNPVDHPHRRFNPLTGQYVLVQSVPGGSLISLLGGGAGYTFQNQGAGTYHVRVTAGGIGLLIGPAGLLWLNLRRNSEHGDARQKPMDRGFIALLWLVSASGLALLAVRETSALGLMLAVHLGLVMAFFLTMPYSKFAHGIFRSAALLKHAIEKRQPNPINAGSD